MSALGTISIKTNDGVYKNYTLSISDKTTQYGQNISLYEKQTDEQRLAKEPKNYLGNGKIYWTDWNRKKEKKVEKETASTSSGAETDLPF